MSARSSTSTTAGRRKPRWPGVPAEAQRHAAPARRSARRPAAGGAYPRRAAEGRARVLRRSDRRRRLGCGARRDYCDGVPSARPGNSSAWNGSAYRTSTGRAPSSAKVRRLLAIGCFDVPTLNTKTAGVGGRQHSDDRLHHSALMQGEREYIGRRLRSGGPALAFKRPNAPVRRAISSPASGRECRSPG